jgi:hypothetical protein
MTVTDETPLAASNGHVPELDVSDEHELDAMLELHLLGLRDVAARELAHVDALDAQLRDARERHKRVQRAIDALTGESKPLGRPPSSTTRRSARSVNASGTHIGRRNVERVLAVLLESEEPLAPPELGRRVELSGRSIHRALDVLRDDGRARIAGVNSAGSKLYAAMPDARPREVAAPAPHLTPDERDERERRIVEYGLEHGEFRAVELVQMLGMSSPQGIGPTMSRLVRNGVLEQTRVEPPASGKTPVSWYRVIGDGSGA